MLGKKVPGDRKREGWKCPIIEAFPKDLPVSGEVTESIGGVQWQNMQFLERVFLSSEEQGTGSALLQPFN